MLHKLYWPILFATAVVMVLGTSAFAGNTPTENEIRAMIKSAEEQFRGTNSESVMNMHVVTKRFERTIRIHSYDLDRKTGMTRILAPKKERGTSILKKDGILFMYTPSIRKTLPIPGSMMGNSFMGSDFSYDDMSRESDMLDDFDVTAVPDGSCASLQDPQAKAAECWVLDFVPKEHTAFAYTKQRVWFDVAHKTYIQIEYFDEGIISKRMTFGDFKTIEGKYVSHSMKLQNLEEPDRSTSVVIESMTFNHNRKPSEFTKAALPNFKPPKSQ